MLRRGLTIAGVALLIFAASVATAFSAPTPQQALDALNRWRAEAGLDPVSGLDPRLSEGCRLHNAYLNRNDVPVSLTWHQEDPNLPGYTAVGDEAARSSVLAGGEGEPQQLWENAVYHRMGLLNPRLRTTWFAASSGHSCMGVTDATAAPAPTFGLFPWPRNGGVGVPTTFCCGEIPSPFDAVPDSVHTLGYLLSAGVDGPWDGTAAVWISDASLAPDGGAPMPITIIDGDDTDESAVSISDFFAIFPHKALLSGTWYTAHAVGSVHPYEQCRPAPGVCPSVQEFDTSWRFKTAGAAAATHLIIVGCRSRDGRAPSVTRLRLRVTTPNSAPVRVSVRRRAKVVAKRRLFDGGHWSPKLPPARYRVCAQQVAAGPYAAYRKCFAVRVKPHR